MEDFSCIDSHFHIWELERYDYLVPNKNWPEHLFKNISIEDYEKAIQPTPVRHGVFVQVMNDCPDETKWLLEVGDKHPIVKGLVVGMNPCKSKDKWKDYLGDNRVVGVRHLPMFEPDGWMVQQATIEALGSLETLNLAFDLVLMPNTFNDGIKVVQSLPQCRFVVDHMGLPWWDRWTQEKNWKPGITEIAKYFNVFCKFSGMTSQADNPNWRTTDYSPYVNHLLSVFGVERCMFGSDWPVSMWNGASYLEMFELSQSLVRHLTPGERKAIYSENAKKFYGLKL